MVLKLFKKIVAKIFPDERLYEREANKHEMQYKFSIDKHGDYIIERSYMSVKDGTIFFQGWKKFDSRRDYYYFICVTFEGETLKKAKALWS